MTSASTTSSTSSAPQNQERIHDAPRLILASQSPRRKDILLDHGFIFECIPSKISEDLNKTMSLGDAIADLARQKAIFIQNQHPFTGVFVLAADTVVILDEEVLGKPKDQKQAYHFLRRLSQRTHEVKTGVCVLHDQCQALNTQTSYVTFRALTDKEIWDYIKTGDPLDKSGAYGILKVRPLFVEKVEGDIDNIRGLPMSLTKRLLLEVGWP